MTNVKKSMRHRNLSEIEVLNGVGNEKNQKLLY